jgi:hypothetical protein
MLAIPEKYRCIECGLPFGHDRFSYYEGDMDNGAAYWCDRGLLCSPICSMKHHAKRLAEGSVGSEPAPDPLD